MSDPYLAEMSATAGFDWLLIDSEHAPNDVCMILAQLQAVASYRVGSIVWPHSGDLALTKRPLNTSVCVLLVPMMDTAEQAHDLMCAMHYPPFGIRGVGSAVGRASRWSARTDYLRVADDEACLLVQAETVVALQNLEAICAVDGMDDVSISPADLAVSMGHRGDASYPEVQAAIDSAMCTVIAPGKAVDMLTSDPVFACHYLELGCTFVAIGIDIPLLASGARKPTRDSIMPQTA